jgi:hypothetical protein
MIIIKIIYETLFKDYQYLLIVPGHIENIYYFKIIGLFLNEQLIPIYLQFIIYLKLER